MNQRYRRQMMLRSRRHRQGEPIGCRCHRRVITVALDADTTVSICEPSWAPLPTQRRVRDLPDIAEFDVGMKRVQDAMAKLGPVAETAAGYFKELREVYGAETD